MKIKWCGHAAFTVASDDGFARFLIDPYVVGAWGDALGYGAIRDACDVLLISHRHEGHFGFNAVRGNKSLVRGYGEFWVQNVKVHGIRTHHDNKGGSERGDNTVFRFALDGVRLAHLGDLGHLLEPAQLAEIGPVDVVLVPCGGGATLDADGAFRVVEQLQPKLVVPMHYKTPCVNAPLDEVLPFTRRFDRVTDVNGSELLVTPETLPAERTVMVLQPAYG